MNADKNGSCGGTVGQEIRVQFDSFFAAMLESSGRTAEVAQLVEQTIRNRQVAGSIPALGSIPPSRIFLSIKQF